MPFKNAIESLHERLHDLKQLLREAGDAIMDIYANEFDIMLKEDRSPVTLADMKSSDIITDGLKMLYNDIPVLSEENAAIPFSIRQNWDYYWLLDPLDGTREFIKRNNEFCINLALIHHNTPIAGFIYQPVKRLLHHSLGDHCVIRTDATDRTAMFNTVSPVKDKHIVVVTSRSHRHPNEKETLKALADAGYKLEFMSMGSAIKFCLMAEGKIHAYLRYGPTSEWDTAAGHALLNAIGGEVINTNNRKKLTYNKEELLNPSFAAMVASVQEIGDYIL